MMKRFFVKAVGSLMVVALTFTMVNSYIGDSIYNN